ncbi:MAG: N-6 DNA methylase [Candidatus Lokiarchaeota archaeon]|nr:N-6 DNA methylase [Candidatus Lokiarchaeota archaeon]
MKMNGNFDNLKSELQLLLQKDTIEGKDLPSLINSLKNNEIKNYLEALQKLSQPEQALRESFFSNTSSFAKNLFQNVFPEVSLEGGFVDYLIKANREEIGLEIKPLYSAEFEETKSGKKLKGLRKNILKPEHHKEQILRYLKGDKEYVVLTNLEQWFLYSKSYSLSKDCPYFSFVELFDLIEEFKQVDDFWQYLDKKEDISIKEPLDKKFYVSLKEWVNQLGEIEFTCSDEEKTEIIITLINKFLFIQSLDKFWVIQKNYLKYQWKHIESLWGIKDKKRFIKKFFEDLNTYFYTLYDTELFVDGSNNITILNYLVQKERNIEKFFRKLNLVLGIQYESNPENWIAGITQYNFRRIDEDILGKTYETYLAELRKEQGIFYTPRYITQYIVKETLKLKFRKIINDILEKIQNEEFTTCFSLIDDLFSIKILDCACGSGSFLIKALKVIWEYYQNILNALKQKYDKYSYVIKGEYKSEDITNKFSIIQKLQEKLFANDLRRLISEIILNYLYGIDLDEKAINIAKLNIWLEAIKLSPKDFLSTKLDPGTNRILPNLKLNLIVGNTLVGLPVEKTVNILETKFKDEIKELFRFRYEYLENPKKIDHINKIDESKIKIKENLDKNLVEYLKEKKISTNLCSKTNPTHLALDFWFAYFNKNGEKKILRDTGFDFVIGNPPWGADMDNYKDFIEEEFEKISKEQYDSFQIFVYHSVRDLLKFSGYLGYIIPNELCLEDGNVYLREFLLDFSLKEISNLGYEVFDNVTRPSMIFITKKEKSEDDHYVWIFVDLKREDKSLIKDDIKTLREIILESRYKRLQNSFKENAKKKFDIFAHPFDKKIKNIIQSNNFKQFKHYVINGRGIDTNKSGKHFICPECGILNPPFGVGRAATNQKDCVNQDCSFVFERDKRESYETEKLIFETVYQEGDHNAPGYIGEDLHRYFFSRKPRLIKYYGDVVSDERKKNDYFKYTSVVWKDHDLYTGEKLLFRKVSSGNLPQVMVYSDFLVTNQQIYIFKKKDEFKEISIYFFLAVLTSRLIHYYYLKEFGDPDKEVMPHFTQSKIKSLPVPEPDISDKKYKKVVENVKKVIQLVEEYKKYDIETFKDFLDTQPIAYTFTFEEYIDFYSDELKRNFLFSNLILEELTNRFQYSYNENVFEMYIKNRIKDQYDLLMKIEFESDIASKFLAMYLRNRDISKDVIKWDALKEIKIPRIVQNIEANISKMETLINKFEDYRDGKEGIIIEINELFNEIDRIIFDYYGIVEKRHQERIIEVANNNGFKVF